MIIRTKIVATIGPASGERDIIRQMVQAGCDVFRINFSHGDDEQRQKSLQNVRDVEAELNHPLAVIADLCGPKIRTGLIAGGSVLLVEGQSLVIQRESIEGSAKRISTTLSELVDAVEVGQAILMDDGKIRMEVVELNPPDSITCRVITGGPLASGKGINLPRTDLKLSALTEQDRVNVAWIAQREFDYVALSFVRRAEDIMILRKLLVEAGSSAKVIAKVEKPEAIDHIDEIIDAADAVMVARGDLGVEMDLPAVPVAQKRIAELCRRAGKCCIIATQMLETMTQSASPTRAEVSDVANAVLDHADAVMLSGETAVGKYPVRTVSMMDDIVAHIQTYHDEHLSPEPVACKSAPTVAAMAAAAREIIEAVPVIAVATYSATGTTVLTLAKSRLSKPILAMSNNMATVRRMCLYYGVEAVYIADEPKHTHNLLECASEYAVEHSIASSGEKIVVISGRPMGKPGATNTIVVHTIP